MKQKYVFGSEQNAVTEKGGRIIVPEDVAKQPEAWLDKRFPVKAWSLDHLGWYRYSMPALVVLDGGSAMMRNGLVVVKFYDRRKVKKSGECQ